ncbi:MAG: 4-hydroxy-tetrahydrodipicolinate synthase, partial [SAR86 cluster bacterium]
MQELKGSFVALVTPMKSNGEIDFSALKELVEWHIESGTHGLVSVGTTGESATLNFNDHVKVLEKTISYIDNKMVAIAGTGANSTDEAIELSQAASSLGYKFALSVTPYYNKPSQLGLEAHYIKIADSADIKNILYNVPSRTACDLEPNTVNKLIHHENIVGIKEAVDDPKRYKALIEMAKDSSKPFYILSGDDPTFFDFMKSGGDGVISVAANVIPSQVAEIAVTLLNGSFEDAEEVNQRYKKLFKLLFVESNPIPVKWMLKKMHKIDCGIRLPL